jgi:hypothetical protein
MAKLFLFCCRLGSLVSSLSSLVPCSGTTVQHLNILHSFLVQLPTRLAYIMLLPLQNTLNYHYLLQTLYNLLTNIIIIIIIIIVIIIIAYSVFGRFSIVFL